jgi:hypothetical protein
MRLQLHRRERSGRQSVRQPYYTYSN